MNGDKRPMYPSLPKDQIVKMKQHQNQPLPIEEPLAQPSSNGLPQAPLLLGPQKTVTTCPFCLASIRTAMKYTTTTRTHMAAAFCSMVLCCCCLPYCLESCKNSDHYCPNCNKYLGTYKK